MCSAAARLSRRRTCHTSCARIASRWPSSRCSEIPFGHTSRGRTMPKIPGSSEAVDSHNSIGFPIPARRSRRRSASTSRPSRNGIASRKAAETRRQRTYHAKRTTTNPQSHTAARRAGSKCIALGEAVEGVAGEIAGIVGWVKGRLSSSIAKYSPPAGAERSSAPGLARWLPRTTNNEKGTRNFADAASQSP